MANLIIITITIIFSTLVISTPISSSADLDFSTPIKNPSTGFEKSAEIQVYLHDVLSGPNQTVYNVANASISATSPSMFGMVQIVDIKMTQNPNYDSPEVGRAQGIIANADLRVYAYVEIGSFYFTSGRFSGSTISVSGRNAISTEKYRELPIVGGTGMLRCARGYVITSTYAMNGAAMSDNVYSYTFYITYVG